MDMMCLICRDTDDAGEFLTRCNHRYHMACLDHWFCMQNEYCPLCKGQTSRIQLLEDLIANRSISESMFNSLESETCDARIRITGSAITYKNEHILAEFLSRRIDLIIPAAELKQLDFIKNFIERALDKSSVDGSDSSSIIEQLNIIEYVTETKPLNIRDSLRRAGKEGRLDIIKYFVEKEANREYLFLAANEAAYIGYFKIVKYFSEKRFPSTEIALKAVQGGHLQIVKYLIGEIKNTAMQGYDFDSALMDCSIKADQIVILRYLVRQGLKCPDGIRIAAGEGRYKMVQFLTKTGNFSSRGAIDAAAAKGHLRIVKYLIELGKDTCSLDIVDMAARYNQTEVVKYLVQIGKPYSNRAFESGYKRNNLEIVKCIIEKGYPCSIEVLDYAAERGFTEMVKYLVEFGARCTSKAVDAAAENGYFDIVKCLVQNGKECTTEAICNAAYYGRLEIVKYLVEAGKESTPDAVDVAAARGHFDIVKVLIESGRHGDNAIFSAIKYGYFEIGKYLLEKGESCKPEAFTEAARKGSIETIRCMLKYDQPCFVDTIDLAASIGHYEVIQLLIENRKGFTLKAIEGAARNGHLEIIRLLMKNEDLLEGASNLRSP